VQNSALTEEFKRYPRKLQPGYFDMFVVMKYWPIPIYLNGIWFMGDWKYVHGVPESGQPISYENQWKDKKLEIYCSLFAVSCLESWGTKHEQGISSQHYSQRFGYQKGWVCVRVCLRERERERERERRWCPTFWCRTKIEGCWDIHDFL